MSENRKNEPWAKSLGQTSKTRVCSPRSIDEYENILPWLGSAIDARLKISDAATDFSRSPWKVISSFGYEVLFIDDSAPVKDSMLIDVTKKQVYVFDRRPAYLTWELAIAMSHILLHVNMMAENGYPVPMVIKRWDDGTAHNQAIEMAFEFLLPDEIMREYLEHDISVSVIAQNHELPVDLIKARINLYKIDL